MENDQIPKTCRIGRFAKKVPIIKSIIQKEKGRKKKTKELFKNN